MRIPGLFNDKDLRRKRVYESLDKLLAFCEETPCRLTMLKGMHAEVEEVGALQDGKAHLAGARTNGEGPLRGRLSFAVCHGGE